MPSQHHYIGETVSVGIDVHKNSYSVASVVGGVVVKKDSMEASPEKLICYLKKIFDGAQINTAYEAGFSGFHLHRQLVQNGINNIVVHPASIAITARDRVKTDKRDALKIGTQLASGKLQGIHIPSEDQVADRMVTRLRTTFIRNRNRYANQLKALLFQYGLIKAYDDSIVSKKWIEMVRNMLQEKDHPNGFKYAAQSYMEEWLTATCKIKEIDKQLAEQAKKK